MDAWTQTSLVYKLIKMEETNFEEMEKFTIEDLQKNFDEIMERVENGETFLIESEYGNAVIVPYKEVIDIFKDEDMDEDLIRIHTNHEDGP